VPKTYKILGVLWWLFITIICLVELKIQTVSTPSFTDKIVHFSMYFILNYLFLKSRSVNNYLFSSILILYGIIIEVLQELFTVSRHFDIYDIFANSFGVIVALMLFLFLKQKKNIT
jgi:hypothetical protein